MTTSRTCIKSAFAILPVLLAGSLLLPQPLKASAGPGENPVQLRFAAMDAILHGNSKDALDLYETAIQEASQQYGDSSTFLADLYYEAGTAALDSSQFPVAERYLTMAVKINPYSTMAKIKLAELYRLQEKPEEASKQFRQAVQINPSPVTRQAYIRWLATNGRTPQEGNIATQESLKLAMLTARSNENSRLLNLNGKGKQAATGSQMPMLPPALIAPLTKEKAPPTKADKPAEKSVEKPAEIKAESKPKSNISLFPFKNVAKEQVLEKEKQEKLRREEKVEAAKQESAKQEAARQEAAAKARLAEEKARDREAQARKRANAAEKAKASAPAKKAEPKPAAKPEVTPAAVKEEKPVEKIEKKEPKPEPKSEPKKEAPKAVEQPQQNIVPAPQQPSYPQMIYGVPTQVKKPTGKAARTMVPPPPPMPIFPGMQPMMRPAMPNFQPPVERPVVKPKPAAKPKPEVKEQPEDKPPPMTNQAESEPEFILDWGEVKPKPKKGR
ncbi:MAG: hypothetical protein WCT03_01765 [Candidatus Obscuribacterales bacterium]